MKILSRMHSEKFNLPNDLKTVNGFTFHKILKFIIFLWSLGEGIFDKCLAKLEAKDSDLMRFHLDAKTKLVPREMVQEVYQKSVKYFNENKKWMFQKEATFIQEGLRDTESKVSHQGSQAQGGIKLAHVDVYTIIRLLFRIF